MKTLLCIIVVIATLSGLAEWILELVDDSYDRYYLRSTFRQLYRHERNCHRVAWNGLSRRQAIRKIIVNRIVKFILIPITGMTIIVECIDELEEEFYRRSFRKN